MCDTVTRSDNRGARVLSRDQLLQGREEIREREAEHGAAAEEMVRALPTVSRAEEAQPAAASTPAPAAEDTWMGAEAGLLALALFTESTASTV